jgi:hypothetical protein
MMTDEEKDKAAEQVGEAATPFLQKYARRVLMVIQWRDGTGSCHAMGEDLETEEKQMSFAADAVGNVASHISGGGKVKVLIEKLDCTCGSPAALKHDVGCPLGVN